MEGLMPDIHLEGTVGAPFWPDEAHFTPATVRDALAAAEGQPVTVHLNSGGGVATDGLAIYHALKAYPGGVDVVVTGIAASAASLVAMAGRTITMRAGSMLMIHDAAMAWIDGRGTESDHRAIADALGKMSDGYAAIYAARAGIDTAAARDIMRAESWFDAAEAVAAGFADVADDAPAARAAAFAYGAYTKTPRHLLGGTRADGPGRQAVLAMISGGNPAKPKGSTMTSEDDEDARLATDGEDTPEGGSAEDLPPEDDEAADPESTDGENEDEEDEAAEEAAAICDLVAMHSGTLAEAGEFLARRMTLSQVVAHYRQKGQTVPKPNAAGSQARITRDERETRRAGMTAALLAQILRREPDDAQARPYMGMSLAQMAATANGYRGSLRTAHDRLTVFTMDGGMHTTSDFPLALSNALNKALAARYGEAMPIYRQIARQTSFRDFRPQSVIRAGDFPALQAVSEHGEIKSGTIGESAETVALVAYGIKVGISRQTLVNDDIGAIADAIADQGRAVARFEEQVFFATCFGNSGNGPTLSNTRAVFNTTDTTKAGSGSAITVLSVGAGRAAIRKHTSISGAKLNLSPKILLTSPDKETEAEQVTSPLVPAAATAVNPFSGRLNVLSTAQLAGNGWYLLTDPADAALFNFGFLEGASAPRMRMEDLMGQQGIVYQLEHDFGCGATGRVGGWFDPGA
jgi:ATP-dependent protease ClpP protease subunit